MLILDYTLLILIYIYIYIYISRTQPLSDMLYIYLYIWSLNVDYIVQKETPNYRLKSISHY